MTGRIRWGEQNRCELAREDLLGLSVLTLTIPVFYRHHQRRCGKAIGMLTGHRVTRALVPAEFEFWPLLHRCGIRPVETAALRCALAPGWVEASLKAKGVAPMQAIVSLTGERVSADMVQVAHALCRHVRGLMLDVPGGSALAAELRREYGLPVRPPRAERADLTVEFDPAPVLKRVSFFMKDGRSSPEDCASLSVFSVLWDNNRIRTEDIGLKV